jgi:hypothetical protein
MYDEWESSVRRTRNAVIGAVAVGAPKSAAGTSKTETSSGDIARMRQEIDRPKVAKRQPGALAISRTSVRTAKLRFFSECSNASEDKGYHRNFRAGNPAL